MPCFDEFCSQICILLELYCREWKILGICKMTIKLNLYFEVKSIIIMIWYQIERYSNAVHHSNFRLISTQPSSHRPQEVVNSATFHNFSTIDHKVDMDHTNRLILQSRRSVHTIGVNVHVAPRDGAACAVTLSNITRSPRQLLTLSNRKRFLFIGFWSRRRGDKR